VFNDDAQSPERLEAIQEAALLPSAHRRYWDKYAGNLPSDQTIKYDLRRDSFSEAALETFLKEFRNTLRFAELTQSESEESADHEYDVGARPLSPQRPLPKSRQAGEQTYPIPLSTSKQVRITGPFPLSEQEWAQLMNVLKVLKPGLVETEAGELLQDGTTE
jgi:hypothetical protein